MATGKNEKNGGSNGSRKVNWDDSKMQTSYANICNVSSSREEVTLLFGTNQTWHAGQKDVTIQLSNRIVLNPFAAKRLHLLLDATVKKYEETFGEIVIDAQREDVKSS